jgi:hypothetical protein
MINKKLKKLNLSYFLETTIAKEEWRAARLRDIMKRQDQMTANYVQEMEILKLNMRKFDKF